MVYVQVMPGITTSTVDFPSEKTVKAPEGKSTTEFKRSVKGSLRLAPGTVEMTEDEYEYLTAKRKDLARYLHVLRRDPKVVAKAEEPAKTLAVAVMPGSHAAPKAEDVSSDEEKSPSKKK